jgi:hypothetical protein
MTKQLNTAANILLVVLVLLALGWVYGVIANWGEIESRPVRLAYIICDFLIVIPVGLAAVYGLKRSRPWGGAVFALALGALLFDIAHGIFYILVPPYDNYFGLPWPLALLLLAVVVAYTVYAVRALVQARASV